MRLLLFKCVLTTTQSHVTCPFLVGIQNFQSLITLRISLPPFFLTRSSKARGVCKYGRILCFGHQQNVDDLAAQPCHRICRLFSARQSSCASPLTILCQSWQKWYTVYKGDTAEQKACNSLIKPHEQCLI